MAKSVAIFNRVPCTQLITSPLSRHHRPEREVPCHLLLIHRTCCLISPLYISQPLRDANVLFTGCWASAVDVIANLFDRQLGNELMMAFRPRTETEQAPSSLPPWLPDIQGPGLKLFGFVAAERQARGKSPGWLENKKPNGVAWLFGIWPTCQFIPWRLWLVHTWHCAKIRHFVNIISWLKCKESMGRGRHFLSQHYQFRLPHLWHSGPLKINNSELNSGYHVLGEKKPKYEHGSCLYILLFSICICVWLYEFMCTTCVQVPWGGQRN